MLVLNGLQRNNPLTVAIREEFEKFANVSGNATLTWFDTAEMEIKYCNGCGYCSDVKPGVCAKKDRMQEIYPAYARARRVVFISPIRFGGFGGELKKVIDRFSPFCLPTYTIHRGEMHHPPRYRPLESFVGIGVLAEPNANEEETFKTVSSRLAKGFFSRRFGAVFLDRTMDVKTAVDAVRTTCTEAGIPL